MVCGRLAEHIGNPKERITAEHDRIDDIGCRCDGKHRSKLLRSRMRHAGPTFYTRVRTSQDKKGGGSNEPAPVRLSAYLFRFAGFTVGGGGAAVAAFCS